VPLPYDAMGHAVMWAIEALTTPPEELGGRGVTCRAAAGISMSILKLENFTQDPGYAASAFPHGVRPKQKCTIFCIKWVVSCYNHKIVPWPGEPRVLSVALGKRLEHHHQPQAQAQPMGLFHSVSVKPRGSKK